MRILFAIALILFGILNLHPQLNKVHQDSEKTETVKEKHKPGLSDYDEPAMAKRCRKNKEPKKCTSEFVKNYVFSRLTLPNDLPPGRQEIKVHFTIDQNGKVQNATAEGNSESLKKAGMELAARLPDFIPAKLNGKPVSVEYTLPISFIKH